MICQGGVSLLLRTNRLELIVQVYTSTDNTWAPPMSAYSESCYSIEASTHDS